MTVSKRKLIEVALPLEAINRAGRSEKNRKTGTIRNVHKWFAPMPAPVWRALLAACLMDDAGDHDLRAAQLEAIERLVPPDGTVPTTSVKSALQEALALTGQAVPPVVVVDPFVGAGSTLIEAERLGLAALGGDLNPVPVLISKTLVELYPRLPRLDKPRLAGDDQLMSSKWDVIAADITALAKEIRDAAFAEIGHAYPDVEGATPYAYLWAYSVPCPNPACNVRVPLYATEALSRSKSMQAWLRCDALSDGSCSFSVVQSKDEATKSTKSSRGQFACPGCDTRFGVDYLKSDTSRLEILPIAVMAAETGTRVMFGSGQVGDVFGADLPKPDTHETPLPIGGLGLRVQAYGLSTYEEMFSKRQVLSVSTFAHIVRSKSMALPERVGSVEYAQFLAAMLGLCVGKMAHSNSKQSTWRIDSRNGAGKVEAGFGQSVLSMVWDFAEVNPFGGSVGDWLQIVDTSLRGLVQLVQEPASGEVIQTPAQGMHEKFIPGTRYLVATDPPYFDAIGYADLSDFFYVWHRDALRDVFPEIYQTASVPRAEELVADKSRHEGDDSRASEFFIDGFRRTFETLAQRADPEFPMIVVYAHQQREERHGEHGSTGWEALLEALIRSKLMVTASWPIHCTSQTRLRGQDSNALSAYVALVCRPRPTAAPATDRRGFISALKAELPPALRAMQQGSVAPIDLAQASVGPGMAAFTRHSRVVEADGAEMTVRTALALINQTLGEVVSDQEGDFDAETRFCVRWFSQFGWSDAPSGEADVLSRAVNTSVSALERGGVFRATAGRARLVEPSQMPPEWSPAHDKAISIWEVAVRLAHALQTQGIAQASEWMSAAATRVSIDVVKELCYMLYTICEEKAWTESAQAFNALGTSWVDVVAASRGAREPRGQQSSLDFGVDDD